MFINSSCTCVRVIIRFRYQRYDICVDLRMIYVSVNSKPDHSPTATQEIRTLSLPGVGFSPSFLSPVGRGFELEKFFYSFERKMQELLDLFQRNRRKLEKQVFCAVSYQFLQEQ